MAFEGIFIIFSLFLRDANYQKMIKMEKPEIIVPTGTAENI